MLLKSGFCFGSKEKGKIENCKIVIKIDDSACQIILVLWK